MNRFVFFAAAWFVLSAYGFFMRPPSVGIPLFAHFDKFVHFALFFGQFWLIARAYGLHSKVISLPVWGVCALIWAVAVELVQSQLPNRSADVFDVVADMAGALCALLLAQAVMRNRLRLLKEANNDC